jgi:hypothetical protein
LCGNMNAPFYSHLSRQGPCYHLPFTLRHAQNE